MYHDVHADYRTFRLPAWFAGPEQLVADLQALWEHDDTYFALLPPADRNRTFDDDIACIASGLYGSGDAAGVRRYGYLGWALALECAETIWLYDPSSRAPSAVLDAVAPWLADPTALAREDWSRWFSRPFPNALEEAVDTALSALEDFARLLTGATLASESVQGMLEVCLDQAAIAPHTWSFETIRRWVLIEVVPAAWSLRLPERRLARDIPVSRAWATVHLDRDSTTAPWLRGGRSCSPNDAS